MSHNNNSWGCLGNVTPERMKAFMDMPVGEFSKLVKKAKKGWGKMRDYPVEVSRVVSYTKTHTINVYAGSTESAYEQARILVKDFDWSKIDQVKENVSTRYQLDFMTSRTI